MTLIIAIDPSLSCTETAECQCLLHRALRDELYVMTKRDAVTILSEPGEWSPLEVAFAELRAKGAVPLPITRREQKRKERRLFE